MNSKQATIISVIVGVVLVGGALALAFGGGGSGSTGAASGENVTMAANGEQVIDLTVKGGYAPRKSTAKAGIPTILRLNTNSTFDCSASVRIPSLGIRQNLPPTGATEISLGTPKAGKLQGSCGMGMYPFEIEFS